MRAVVQRVSRASVRVDGEVVGAIGPGLCVLVGVTHDDDEPAARLADKLWDLRIFPDEDGAMNRSRPTGARGARGQPVHALRRHRGRAVVRRSWPRPPEVAEPLVDAVVTAPAGAGRDGRDRPLRRGHGGRARQRRTGDDPVRDLTAPERRRPGLREDRPSEPMVGYELSVIFRPMVKDLNAPLVIEKPEALTFLLGCGPKIT